VLPLAAAIVWTFFNELLGRYTGSLASLAVRSRLLSCTLFGYAKCHLVSNIFLEYRNHDVWLCESLGMATIYRLRCTRLRSRARKSFAGGESGRSL